MRVTRSVVALLAIAGCSGCAATSEHPISIAVVVDGQQALSALPRVAGLELSRVEMPSPLAAPTDTSAGVIATARSAYASGELDSCRQQLATLDVPQLLADRQRATAARALVLEIACAWGATDRGTARAQARRFAAYGLELPDLAISPDVEREIGAAITAVGKTRRLPMEVSGVIGARLSVDGRDPQCTLPCTVDVSPGEHVMLVDADGYQPAVRTVRVESALQLAVNQVAATSALAAQQWSKRTARGNAAADSTGARLLAAVAQKPRVVYLHAGTTIAGTMIVDGTPAATGVRARGEAGLLIRELAYDAGVLRRPSVWQRSTFWIAASGVVLVAAIVTVALVYEPDRQTRLVPP